MKKIKDKKIIVLILILVVFTIGYFVIANRVSYAFVDNTNSEYSYNRTIDTIEMASLSYANNHLEDFTEEGLLYITVQTLIDEGYLVGYQDNVVTNPLDSTQALNEKKIRLKLESDEVTFELYS